MRGGGSVSGRTRQPFRGRGRCPELRQEQSSVGPSESDRTLLSGEGGAAASAQAHGGRWAPRRAASAKLRQRSGATASVCVGNTGLPCSEAHGSACGDNDDVTGQGASILNYEKPPRGGRGWLGHFWFPPVIPRRCPAPAAGRWTALSHRSLRRRRTAHRGQRLAGRTATLQSRPRGGLTCGRAESERRPGQCGPRPSRWRR